jgi:parvulin-like peptidyl-prolyl isomerase
MTLIVDGEKIEDTVIKQEVERLRPHYEQAFAEKSAEEREKQLIEWSTENVIERTVLRQYAAKNAEPVSPEKVQATLEQIRKNAGGDEELKKELGTEVEKELTEQIESQLQIESVLEHLRKDLPDPSEEAITSFYEDNKEQFKSPEQIRVAHIVKHINWQADEATAQESIQKAREELSNGAVFETVAVKYSDCPENAGDLGYITRGQMVEEFEDVVFNMNVNDISDIFRTRFGFHIARLYDRKPSELLTVDKVKDQIASQLKNQMQEEALDNFLDDLKTQVKIERL